MRENRFQSQLIRRLSRTFPGCIILKNDSGYLQGIPDLLILYMDRWAALEVKASEREPYEPNQEWYIQELNAMSFAACIYPENQEEILDALQSAFTTRRKARLSKRQ